MEQSIIFRKMQLNDIDQVLNIERQSFPHPWSRDAFESEILINKYALYFVLECEGTVIGYCGSWVIIDEAHITNIALLPEYRGKKLGEFLLRKMIELFKEKNVIKITLEVRVSNIVAQSLYRKFGFQDGGIRKNYYTDNQEDALVMWVNLE